MKMNKKIIIIFFSLIISLGVTLLLLSWGGFQSSNDVNSEKLRGDNKITLQNAAEKGDMVAQSELGFLYETQKDYKQAAYWYNKSAQQGYAPAQYNIGVAYRYGRGVTQDLKKASEWYQKSATQGVVKAQVNLGMLYLLGTGVPVDYNNSRQWFMKASESGDTIAIFNIGQLYFYGLGVPKDYSQAEIWLKKALALGSMRAKNSLALFYGQGLGDIPLNINEAMKILESSACQGYVVAQENLGAIYMGENSGFPKNYLQSYAWYAVAAENGSKKAKQMQAVVIKNLAEDEIKKAKSIAMTYIKKYPAPIDENDTNKSNDECKYP